jgi:4a-hydroxytetrahydrobiopterin dehydratase
VKRGDPGLADGDIEAYLAEVPDWSVVEREGIKRLERRFKFKNFAEALAFTNKIGAIAEEQDHHPLIQTEWGKVSVNWWTHVIGGLHLNDFIMAARTDGVIEGS